MPDIDMPCPRTGRLVATGLSLPAEAFETADLSTARFDCPACGELHRIDKEACRLLTGWRPAPAPRRTRARHAAE